MVRHANVQAPSARPGESRPVEAGVPEAATASNLDDLDDEALMAADFEEGQGHEADNSGTDVGEQEDEQLAQALQESKDLEERKARERASRAAGAGSSTDHATRGASTFRSPQAASPDAPAAKRPTPALPPTEAQWRQIVIDSLPPDDDVIRRAGAEEEAITMF